MCDRVGFGLRRGKLDFFIYKIRVGLGLILGQKFRAMPIPFFLLGQNFWPEPNPTLGQVGFFQVKKSACEPPKFCCRSKISAQAQPRSGWVGPGSSSRATHDQIYSRILFNRFFMCFYTEHHRVSFQIDYYKIQKLISIVLGPKDLS